MGSDKPGGFQCSYSDPSVGGFPAGSAFETSPSSHARRAQGRARRAAARASRRHGRQPRPVARVDSRPAPRAGLPGTRDGLPTFAGARAEIGISGRLPVDPAAPYDCRHDGGTWTPCSFTFRMPIQHAGRHTLQARQRQPGGEYPTTRELLTTVEASKRNTTIVGLQMTLVLERSGALAPLTARAPGAQPACRAAHRHRARALRAS